MRGRSVSCHATAEGPLLEAEGTYMQVARGCGTPSQGGVVPGCPVCGFCCPYQ